MSRPRSHPQSTLTNTAIARLLPGEVLRDNEVPGLSVRCHGSGRSFMLSYARHGKRRHRKIGICGVVSLRDARVIARRMLTDLAAGTDPAATRDAERSAPTMRTLWVRAVEQHYTGETGWSGEARRIWSRYLEPRIAGKRVCDFDYDDTVKIQQALRESPSQANRALAVLSKILGLAERWKMRPLGTNPCQHVARFPERSRKRFASADELYAIGDKLRLYANANPTGVAFIYLIAFSGARPSEIERATWAQLQRMADGAGVLRIADGKTGERNVFLPPQAMEVIDRLPRTGSTILGRNIPRKLWEKIRGEIGAHGLWLRDLRRTFATVGMSNGVNAGVVGELLGHASAQTTKIYAKLMEDPAASATRTIADRMAGLLGEVK